MTLLWYLCTCMSKAKAMNNHAVGDTRLICQGPSLKYLWACIGVKGLPGFRWVHVGVASSCQTSHSFLHQCTLQCPTAGGASACQCMHFCAACLCMVLAQSLCKLAGHCTTHILLYLYSLQMCVLIWIPRCQCLHCSSLLACMCLKSTWCIMKPYSNV